MPISITPGAMDPDRPHSRQEVLHWVAQGRISSETAVRYLRESAQAQPRALGGSLSPNSFLPETVQAVLQELDDLVGLPEIKRLVREIYAFVEVQRRRQDLGLKTDSHMLHMIFKGSPGTGKTTVARILGRLLQAMAVLPKGQVIEAERADLVGEYIGHTAQKTRELIKRSMGGVLFVDEAYSLARGGDKDFGKEAIDTLVKAMEDQKTQWVLILAGYSHEMAYFLETNPGLRSRFAIVLDFPNYTPIELLAIIRQMARLRQYYITRETETELMKYFDTHQNLWHTNAGNARMVRNLLEKAIRRQAVRLMHRPTAWTRDDLMQLVGSDFDGGQ